MELRRKRTWRRRICLSSLASCCISRSSVDSSICSTSSNYGSKFMNDGSKDQPTVPIVSGSTSASNTESNVSTPRIYADLKVSSQLRKFTFNELKSATRNFRPDSLLDEGGFGCVFKGWIEENGTAPVKPGTGLTVAVKTLNHDGLQGHKEWLAEVNFLGDLLYPHFVRLIGYFIEDDERLLKPLLNLKDMASSSPFYQAMQAEKAAANSNSQNGRNGSKPQSSLGRNGQQQMRNLPNGVRNSPHHQSVKVVQSPKTDSKQP